jgi:hypothetical protein
MMDAVVLKSTITCPVCEHMKDELMLTDACVWFYACEHPAGLTRLLRRAWNNRPEEHDPRLKVIAEGFESMWHMCSNEQKISGLESNNFILAPERAVT